MKKFALVIILLIVAFVSGNAFVRDWLWNQVPSAESFKAPEKTVTCTYTLSTEAEKIREKYDKLEKELLQTQIETGQAMQKLQEIEKYNKNLITNKEEKALKDILDSIDKD